jgi:ankyrin repeat protein
MDPRPLPFDAGLERYQEQAARLLDAHAADGAAAINLLRHHHPRFLDERIPWLPKRLDDSAIAAARLDLDDARLALARWYDFADWAALAGYAESVNAADSPVRAFEAAVEAVVNGDQPCLAALLGQMPDLVRARSTRRTHFDPPLHAATLLHYVAANGVENQRQKTPPNAVEIARTLLEAGAEADALAGFYGVECTTLSLLVSSSHPAAAGVQGALVETLLDYGAAIEGAGTDKWGTPLITALVFGCLDAAHTLVKRGANAASLPAAAGLGLEEEVRRALAGAGERELQWALALAALHGHAGVVRELLRAGADPDRYHPEKAHAHATPLHHAAWHGHAETVRALVEAGARLDIRDKIYQATPLGWALHARRDAIADYLRPRGAR